MRDEILEEILDAYYSNEEYAACVDKYIEEYMDVDTYTKDDIRGILETMNDESLTHLSSM